MGVINKVKTTLSKAIDYERVKQQTKNISDIAKTVFEKQAPKRKESFEEALARLNLSEQDIHNRTKEFKRLIAVFLFLFVGLLVYLLYAIYEKAWIASLGTSGILLFVCAQLFRYHFWLFQIKQQRLGCTFREWCRALFNIKNVDETGENHP